MQKETILLCLGSPVIRGNDYNSSISNSMIPVNGKPILGRILDDLLEKGINNVIVVHHAADFQLPDFLHLAYSDRMKIKLVPVLSNGNIVDSLRKGLELLKGTEVRVVLGDTLILDSFNLPFKDYVYVNNVPSSSRWCVVNTTDNGVISEFIEKKELSGDSFQALAGYFYFSDVQALRAAMASTLQKNSEKLSDLLRFYNNLKQLQAVRAEECYNFGNIDTFFTSKARLLSGRYFNSLNVDPVLNTITKVSIFNEKLKNELDWYLKIPEELKVLTPRIIEKKVAEEKVTIIQEYYGYPTLAEIFVFYNLHPDVWAFILNNLFVIHERIKSYKGSLPPEAIRSIYLTKTEERLNQLSADDYWKELSGLEEVQLNGKVLKNLSCFREFLKEQIEKLVNNTEVSIIHGDFGFSNILFDLNALITRFIDPRGSFGEPGIYGDPRYDIAKMRHSIGGLYDFIIADLFLLEESKTGVFNLKIYKPEVVSRVSETFDKMLVERGYDLKEIKIIESLLFLSMIPLHKEKPQRQKVMYLRGISLLNEICQIEDTIYENSN